MVWNAFGRQEFQLIALKDQDIAVDWLMKLVKIMPINSCYLSDLGYATLFFPHNHFTMCYFRAVMTSALFYNVKKNE